MSEPAIEAYLGAVAGRLIGPQRSRRAILLELRDGLLTSAEAHHGRGRPWPAAVAAAVEEFGPAPDLAALYAADLACERARAIGRSYLLTGPLVGMCWLLLLAPAGWWRSGPGALGAVLPALPLAAGGALAGLGLVVATGRRRRRIRIGAADLLDLAAMLGLICIAADAVMLVDLWRGAPHSGPVAALAVLASSVRLISSCAVVRRCLAGRRHVVGG